MIHVPEEAMNCIHQCRSPECYKLLYGEDPLELGQIDTARALEFDQCNRREIVLEKKQERHDRKNRILEQKTLENL
jgi:hypothetical protein